MRTSFKFKILKKDIIFNSYVAEIIYSSSTNIEDKASKQYRIDKFEFSNEIRNNIKNIVGFKLNIESLSYGIQNNLNPRFKSNIDSMEVFCLIRFYNINDSNSDRFTHYKFKAYFINEKTLQCVFNNINLYLNKIYELFLSFNNGSFLLATNIKIDYFNTPFIGMDSSFPTFEINPSHFYKTDAKSAFDNSIDKFKLNGSFNYNLLIDLNEFRNFIRDKNNNTCVLFDKSFNFELINRTNSLDQIGNLRQNSYLYKIMCKINIFEISDQINEFIEKNYILKQSDLIKIISNQNFYFSNFEISFDNLMYSNKEKVFYSISMEIESMSPLLVNLFLSNFNNFFFF